MSTRRRRRAQKSAILAAVAVLHTTLLFGMTRSLRPPTTRGDGSSDNVALSVALVPASTLDIALSQGADTHTQTLAVAPTEAKADKASAQAQGAGVKPDTTSSGSHDEARGQTAPATRDGGGGGAKDDPWARASLKPELNTLPTFDLAARNDALFLARVQPCLRGEARTLAGIAVSVTLGADGKVIAAKPLRVGVSASEKQPPNRSEAEVIAAIQACAPYHDLLLGRTPVLKVPPAGAAASPMIAASLTPPSPG